jgi:hypothetical protein
MPGGLLVTVPVPVPVFVTVSVRTLIVVVTCSVALLPEDVTSFTVNVHGPGVAPVESYVTWTVFASVGPMVMGLAGPLLGVVVLVNVPPHVVLNIHVHNPLLLPGPPVAVSTTVAGMVIEGGRPVRPLMNGAVVVHPTAALSTSTTRIPKLLLNIFQNLLFFGFLAF